MFPAPLVQERQRAKTSESFWRRSSALSAVPFMSLDLTPGHGNLLGESYWELISPWLGGAWMLNTGVSPNDARESSLSQILWESTAAEAGTGFEDPSRVDVPGRATYGFEGLPYQSAGRGYRPARRIRCLDGDHQYADADLRDAAG